MKIKVYLCLIILLLSLSCIGQKKDMISSGDYTTAIKNAINDFYKNSSLIKQDAVFSVSYNNINPNIIEVSIIGNPNKFYIDGDKPLNRLPTNYVEYTNKMFYWHDDNQNNFNPETIKKLQQYKLVEYNADIIEYNIDDKKKGVSYFFCKKDLTKYKKIKSSISTNEVPKLSCK